MAEERVQRRLAAILAADMVGYSRLMGADEEGTIARQKDHRTELIDRAIAGQGGRIVKTMGDGLLVEFPSVVDAVRCAVEVQRGMSQREADMPEDRRIQYRVGINLGDIVIDGDDILGDGVNIAARLESLADPGGICISAKVFEEISNKIHLEFEDLGLQKVKNIAGPVHAYRALLAQTETEENNPSSIFDKPSIAVLAFDNIGGDPDQEYFSDGVTEDIITALSHIRPFQVTARNSTFTYKGQAVDVRIVARELGVRYVLEGSVRKSGKRVRITAQLIEGGSGNHIWAERYDRDLEDIFAVQDEITQTVVAALQPEVTRSEMERALRKPPESLNAWDYCQQGWWHLYRNNQQEVAAARKLFAKAIEADPDFVYPFCGIVECDVNDLTFGYAEIDREDTFAYARKAVALDPRNSSAHRALGIAHFLNKNHPAAITEFDLAIKLNPSDASCYPILGFAQSFSGHAEDSLKNFKMAMQLSPRDQRLGWFHNGMGVSFLHMENHKECVDWVRRALQHPDAGWPIRSYMISALAHLDRMDECQQEVSDLLVLQPNCTISSLLRSRLTTYQPYSDHYVEGLRKAGLAD